MKKTCALGDYTVIYEGTAEEIAEYERLVKPKITRNPHDHGDPYVSSPYDWLYMTHSGERLRLGTNPDEARRITEVLRDAGF